MWVSKRITTLNLLFVPQFPHLWNTWVLLWDPFGLEEGVLHPKPHPTLYANLERALDTQEELKTGRAFPPRWPWHQPHPPCCPGVTLQRTHLIRCFSSPASKDYGFLHWPRLSNFSSCCSIPIGLGFHDPRFLSPLQTLRGLLSFWAFAYTVPFDWNILLPLIHPALVYLPNSDSSFKTDGAKTEVHWLKKFKGNLTWIALLWLFIFTK